MNTKRSIKSLLSAFIYILAAVPTSAQQPTRVTDQEISDAYIYLLGRLLVMRQQQIDFQEGFKWNEIIHRKPGAVDWPNPNLDVAYSEAWVAVDENSCTNLDKTTVRAPADGYVTNVALRKGARVANLPLAPVMAFIDTADTIIGVEIPQNDARFVKSGQEAEVTFKFSPGMVYVGKVESVLQAIATGQMSTSGAAATPKAIQAAPFVVRVVLDDPDFARTLPAGSTGEAAIFTDHLKATHIVRKVLLRQTAILRQSVLTHVRV